MKQVCIDSISLFIIIIIIKNALNLNQIFNCIL